ncbi:hypothetical protein [Pseudomonas sp. GZD-222]|uniref:hypothetical protein n=1 Tax=Pseudomonas sp. GZD-222 TaxID=3404805 RepID=UPI003BB6E246
MMHSAIKPAFIFTHIISGKKALVGYLRDHLGDEQPSKMRVTVMDDHGKYYRVGDIAGPWRDTQEAEDAAMQFAENWFALMTGLRMEPSKLPRPTMQ